MAGARAGEYSGEMLPEPMSLSPARKLATLQTLDVFHHWESIDEERFCRRCGEIISGRAIKVFAARRDGAGLRLECPTDGCPAVPIEWVVIEQADAAPIAPIAPTIDREPRRFFWHRLRAPSR
jgi:hypothetical protein